MLRFAPTSSLNPQTRYQLPSVTPRDRYLAVLAQARAAEAEYVSALLRENAEQRLREDRLREQAIRRELLLDSVYRQEPAYPTEDLLFPSTYGGPFRHASYPAALSHSFDIEREEQELLSTLQRRQHAAESGRIQFLRRQQEISALQSRRRRQEEDLRRFQRGRGRQDVHRRRTEVEGLEQVLGVVLGDTPIEIVGCKEPQRVAERNPHTQSDLFARLLGVAAEPVVAAVPRQQEAPQSRPKVVPQHDFLAHFLGGATGTKEQEADVHPVSKSVSQPQVEASSSTSPKVHAEARCYGDREAEFRNTVRALVSSLFSSVDASPEPQPKPKRQPQPKPVPQAPMSEVASKVPSAASVVTWGPSLKEELEARLINDSDAEIRDTAQALIASLYDTSSTSEGASASDSRASSAAEYSGKGKGKAKEVTFDIPVSAATSVDVMHALDTVRNIEASFHALESDFVFPSNLDFESVSPPASPSSTFKLAYTSKNAPVRQYEHSLSSLLTQLDSIDSLGSEDVRNKRKEVVSKVETALEAAEREIEGRSSVWVKKRGATEAARSVEVKEEEDVKTAPFGAEETSQSELAGTAADVVGQCLAPVVEESSPVNQEGSGETAEESVEERAVVASTITIEELDPVAASAISLRYPVVDETTLVEGLFTQPTAEDPIAVEVHEDVIDASDALEANSSSFYPATESIISQTTPDAADAASSSVPSFSPDATQSTDVLDTFLLPASPKESPKSGGGSTLTAAELNDVDEVVMVDGGRDDAGSDWSELEA